MKVLWCYRNFLLTLTGMTGSGCLVNVILPSRKGGTILWTSKWTRASLSSSKSSSKLVLTTTPLLIILLVSHSSLSWNESIHEPTTKYNQWKNPCTIFSGILVKLFFLPMGTDYLIYMTYLSFSPKNWRNFMFLSKIMKILQSLLISLDDCKHIIKQPLRYFLPNVSW